MFTRTKTILATAAILAAPALATVAIAAPADATTKYSSCDKLTRDFPNGVAKSAAAAQKQVRDGNSRPASSKRAQKVYQANKSNLDRDKDGTACEN
ncbi:excalibur calcium-binding domain-containing protein [Nocardioides dongxiaopingii]|uniref:excalibur calcium-binding domain-containing protein n=1 Tax=Nocardioides dongxiaopingii TaxID=2576036 RepID=UPI0010C7680C|nr:excalibur calcium-binding domain-containing protein [Nocardioides dongxiaopingii]